ncbi:MAG: diaminopimelate dehydrogenase [Clostridia bacterium]|nr:diaminopimelate dehydrogenase [Clostridia bacterium]
MKIGIYGYGNLGKGVEISALNDKNIEVVGVFTRRAPETVKTYGTPVYNANDILKFKNDIDVLIICGGSATDLPVLSPTLAENFNIVDSFDTHAKNPTHFANVNSVALKNKTTALISAGWDPGMFSIARVYANAILPNGSDYTFWGRGVSQGHSDAIRRIDGVIDARQYTVPVEESVNLVKSGVNPTLTTRQKHLRECYVVAKDGADLQKIENEIKSMPNYFADYDTTVNFITLEELNKNHKGMPHGGTVIRTGSTGLNNENKHLIEYNLKLDSNPEFTASVLVAYARAVYKLYLKNDFGAKTVFDISPADLSQFTTEELLSKML